MYPVMNSDANHASMKMVEVGSYVLRRGLLDGQPSSWPRLLRAVVPRRVGGLGLGRRGRFLLRQLFSAQELAHNVLGG